MVNPNTNMDNDRQTVVPTVNPL